MPTPAELAEPEHLWVFPTLVYVTFVLLASWAMVDTWRNRRLSVTTLGLVAGTSMWWSEWFGDWGAYLLYNPDYALLAWKSSPWTTPNKPWWMIPAYGVYYAVAIPGGLAVAQRVFRARPQWGRTATVIVVAAVFFYAFDMAIEIPAVTYGWWTYVETWGPTYTSSRGTFPFAYPLLFVVAYVVAVCLLIDWRDDNRDLRFEQWAGVPLVRPGLRRETARLATWVVVLNGAYLLVLMGPLVALRLAFGSDNALVP